MIVAQGHAVVSSASHFARRRSGSSVSSDRRKDRWLPTSDASGGPCSLCTFRVQLPHRSQRHHRLLVFAAVNGPKTVVVSGAAGRTGSIIMQKLLAQPDAYKARGIVRNDEGKKKACGSGVPADSVVVADVARGRTPELDAAMEGADALIVASSAVPQIKKLSLIVVLLKRLFRQEGAVPEFYYRDGQYPEQVDGIGQVAQVDAAKAAGVRRIVLISSMGGTDRGNRLNSFGNGNILVFKRQSEEYLIGSGLEYTILHPGGLTMDEGGQRELLLGVDDGFVKENRWRSVPRAGVAELAVQAVGLDSARNRSVDVVAKGLGEGSPTQDFERLFAELKADCKYGPGSVH